MAASELDSHDNDINCSATERDPAGIWQQGVHLLKTHLDQQIFAAWIKPLDIAAVELEGGEPSGASLKAEVTLIAPNKFCCEHVERHYGSVICSALSQVIGAKDTTIRFKVSARTPNTGSLGTGSIADSVADIVSKVNRSAGSSTVSREPGSPRKTTPGYKRAAIHTAKGTRTNGDDSPSNLNSKYNFSNFVVGGCNQFAYAASLRVSEHLGIKYNPLFLYGGVGLGKTHLANAIGNAGRRRGKKVLLVSSEAFVSELISSLKSNTMDRFKNKFRSLDLLIIDDIQFIIGKERTQEEFFHTFNELYNRQKQIIITSDKIPQELVGLEERLRTRFASGLTTDLQAPDFETRVAIINKKAEANGKPLPDDVAGLLAKRVDTNVRELEGALNRLLAFCNLHDAEPNIALTEEVLKSIAPLKFKEVTTEVIQKVVAERYNVSIHDLTGKRRTHNIAFARQVAMYLCRKLTGCSYPEIGAIFGGRDHSTVIHANKVITEKLNKAPDFQEDLARLERTLGME